MRAVWSFSSISKKGFPPLPNAPGTPLNKKYLIDAVREANLTKPKILPPPKDPSKLTVVMELD